MATRLALATGANGGIGSAICDRLLENGFEGQNGGTSFGSVNSRLPRLPEDRRELAGLVQECAVGLGEAI
jgi:NAD(P)-dependent dehydrogenase (short-subunit alcohol dehydrogenase family)